MEQVIQAIASMIGEMAAYVLGLLAGRTFHLEPKKAQRIGENIIIAVFFGAMIVITLVYS
jgi:hypothetical protein